MEQKYILLSALSMGVGVGYSLASGQTIGKWTGQLSSQNAITPNKLEQDLLRRVIDGRESDIIFYQRLIISGHPLFYSSFNG